MLSGVQVINMFKNMPSVDGTEEESWTLLLQGMRRLELTEVPHNWLVGWLAG